MKESHVKWIIVVLMSLFMTWCCTAKQPEATALILKERENSKNIPTHFIDSEIYAVSWSKR